MADQRGSSARSSGTTDRNLPFGVMALQTVLRDSEVFAESCTLWSGSKGESSPADVLVEPGSLSASDREDVDRFVERKLAQHGGDAGTGCGPAADHRSAGIPGDGLGLRAVDQRAAGLQAKVAAQLAERSMMLSRQIQPALPDAASSPVAGQLAVCPVAQA